MIRLTWRTLWTGGVRTTSTLLALAIGAFLLSLTIILSSTTAQALSVGLSAQYSGADVVVVTADDAHASAATNLASHITEEELAKIATIPAVSHASGYISTTAIVRSGEQIRGVTVESLPNDDTFVWQRLDSGSWPVTNAEIALSRQTLDDLDLDVGDRVVFGKSDVGPGTFTITGAIDTRGAFDYDSAAYGVVNPQIAQVLAGIYGATDVKLALASNADPDAIVAAINDAVPTAFPLTVDEIVSGGESVFGIGLDLLRNVIIALIAISLAVTALVLYTVYSVSLSSRARLLALQRCVGATRGQVFGGVVLEAAILALIAGVLGTALAVVVACALVPILGTFMSAITFATFVVPWQSLIFPILTVIGLSIIASLIPAARASAVSPTRALVVAVEKPTSRAGDAIRIVLAVTLVAGGTAALVAGWRGVNAVLLTVGIAATAIGVLILSRAAYTAASAAVGLVARRVGSVPLELSAANVRRNPRRSAAVGLSVTAAAALITTSWVSLQSASDTLLARISDTPSIDVTVGDIYSAGTITASSQEAIEAIDGVQATLGIVAADDITMVGKASSTAADSTTQQSLPDGAELDVAADSQSVEWKVTVAGMSLAALNDVMRVPYPLTAIDNSTVYLQSSAYEPYEPGSVITIQGPLGSRQVVVEYVDNLAVPALVSPTLYSKLTEQQEVRAVWVSVDRAVDQPLLLDRIRAEAVLTADAPVAGSLLDTVRLDAALTLVRYTATALLGVAMLVALVGLAATTALAIAERRRENALLRVLGLERQQLRRSILSESVVLALTGAVLGAAIGVGYGLVASFGIAHALDLQAEHTIPLLALAVVILVPAVLLRLTAARAADDAARVSPARAITDW